MFYQPNECGGCGKAPSVFGEELLPYLAMKDAEPPLTIYLCKSCTGIVKWTNQIKLVLEVQYRIVSVRQVKPKAKQYQYNHKDAFDYAMRQQQQEPQPMTATEILERAREHQERTESAYDAALRRSREVAAEYINKAESPQDRRDRKTKMHQILYGADKESLLKYLEDLKAGKIK